METEGFSAGSGRSWGRVNASLKVLGPVSGLSFWNYSFELERCFMGKLEAHQGLCGVKNCCEFVAAFDSRGHFGLGFSLKNWMKRVCASGASPVPVGAAAWRLLQPVLPRPPELPSAAPSPPWAAVSPCPAPPRQAWGWAAALAPSSGSSSSQDSSEHFGLGQTRSIAEFHHPQKKFYTGKSVPGTVWLLARIPPLLWGTVCHDTLQSCALALHCSALLSLTLPKIAFYGCWFRSSGSFPPLPGLQHPKEAPREGTVGENSLGK